MRKTALFIGRFQPLHKGHIYAIREAKKKYDVLIVIGSINKKDEKNPFSYRQRKEMLLSIFPKMKIIGIKDTTDEKWTQKIKKLKFDAVISGNERVWKCLEGCNLEKPDFYYPEKYNGTKIRQISSRCKNISGLVPERIVKIIQKTKTT